MKLNLGSTSGTVTLLKTGGQGYHTAHDKSKFAS